VRDQEKIYPAIGSRLLGVPEVWTLGVKPNFPDYTPEERDFIREADLILYPTLNYAQFLTTLGKKIFPSLETHHKEILNHFHYPFVAKLPRSSARGRGVYMIGGEEQLAAYVERTKVAYIQEYIPHDRDLRVVLINHQPVIAYWRIRHPDNFRTNLSQGGKISFDDIPPSGILAAQDVGRKGLKMKGLDLKEILREKLIAGELSH